MPLSLRIIEDSLVIPRVRLEPGARHRCAVALILRDGDEGAELLLIERAAYEQDPWSGNLGLPGGRSKEGEAAKVTAERETMEELGLDLHSARYLGEADDAIGATQPVHVSCFVYAVEGAVTITPNNEVSRTFWVPIKTLLQPHRHLQAEVTFSGRSYKSPAVDILGKEGPVLWGLTYRLIDQLLKRVGHPFPSIDFSR